MSIAGPLASGSRLRHSTSLPIGSEKAVRKPKGRKGKGKEDVAGLAIARAQPACLNPEDIQSTPDASLKELDWEWASLTDSPVSRHAPVFTKDGSYFFTIVGPSVRIHSTATGEAVSTLSSSPANHSTSRPSDSRGHSDVITGVVLHPENSFQLITSSLDGSIRIWDFLEAILLQTITLGQPIFRICVHKKFSGSIFVSAGRPTKRTNKRGVPIEDNATVLRISLRPTDATAQSPVTKPTEILSIGKTRFPVDLGISASGDWLVVIGGHKAYVAQTSAFKAGFTKFVSPEPLTCMAFHPSEDYFATGDDKGNIRSWYCLREEFAVQTTGTEKRAQTTTLHWHAHAVSTLAFTPNGAYLLSGGEESVLVIWQLQSGKKEFIPRLGAPIMTLAVVRADAREEEYLLVLADGTFCFVSSTAMKISRAFPQIKLGPALFQSQTPGLSAPLAIHARTSTLLLPAPNPSSLQAYSPSTSKVVYEVEVSPSNRVSRREDTPVEPSRVLSCTVSDDGNWMATVDAHEGDDSFRGEVCLKIWWWDWKAGYWILNTRIDRPHRLRKVTSISFSPASKDKNALMLVTTGEDGLVKTWRIRTTKMKSGEIEEFWVARSTFTYRSELPSHATWSPDGSLLVVSFGPYAIIYDPVTNVVKSTLTSPDGSGIKSTVFIGQGGRYLLLIGVLNIVVWSLLTQSVCWETHLQSQITSVIPHAWEEVFAVLIHAPPSTEQTDSPTRAFIFDPRSASPTRICALPFSLRNIAWYPHPSTTKPSGFTLVGITHSWGLVLLGDNIPLLTKEGASPRELGGVNAGPARTLFRDIFGESAFTDLVLEPNRLPPRTQPTPDTLTVGIAAKAFSAPAYMMPPLEAMFDSVMDGFLRLAGSPNESDKVEQMAMYDEEEAMEMEEDGPKVAGTRIERVVDGQEMAMFIDLFRQHAVKAPPLPRSSVHGAPKVNGVHQSQPNGIKPPPVASPTSSSAVRANGATPRPSKAAVSNPLTDPIESISPVITGKKRKKTLG